MPITKSHYGVCCFLFVFCSLSSGFSQEKISRLKDKVQNLTNDVSNVLVVNLNSKKSTITDSLGVFSIDVKVKDTVQFTAIQYLTKQIVINEGVINAKTVLVYLQENVINLKEVTVTPYNLTGEITLDLQRLDVEPVITSSSLDLPNADVEKLTQSERLLIEADRGKYVHYYGLALVINTHKILNRISGRTKSLEEMVARDKSMELEQEIIAKFSKKTMSEEFGIPESNIDGFLTYCLSQDNFIELSLAGNSIEIWEYLKVRSIEYKSTEKY